MRCKKKKKKTAIDCDTYKSQDFPRYSFQSFFFLLKLQDFFFFAHKKNLNLLLWSKSMRDSTQSRYEVHDTDESLANFSLTFFSIYFSRLCYIDK